MTELYYLSYFLLKINRSAPENSYTKEFSSALLAHLFVDNSMTGTTELNEKLVDLFESFRFHDKKPFLVKRFEHETAVTIEHFNASKFPTRAHPFCYFFVLEFNGQKNIFIAKKIENNSLVFYSLDKKYNLKPFTITADNAQWWTAFSTIPGFDINPRIMASIKLLNTAVSENKGENFTYLSPIFDGVGDYHINHFIGYFRPAGDVTVSDLLTNFYNAFPEIFSKKNDAIASKGNLDFEGKATIRFELITDFVKELRKRGLVHSDWVSMELYESRNSFFAKTLKRNWGEPSDILMVGNQYHFLAGRRSWSVGIDPESGLFFVETAAFERSSLLSYQLIDSVGVFRNIIEDLWTNLILNFAQHFNVALVPISLDGYRNKENVFFKTFEGDFYSAISQPWFKNIYKTHLGLIKDL